MHWYTATVISIASCSKESIIFTMWNREKLGDATTLFEI